MIVGGTFAISIPYMIGSSYDYRLIILSLPLIGFLLWIKESPANSVKVTLWILVFATLLTVLTSASMAVNEYRFIVPRNFIIAGDAALATVLAFGVALFINAWLPNKKVSA
jgi:uncharacterized membrane protein YccC